MPNNVHCLSLAFVKLSNKVIYFAVFLLLLCLLFLLICLVFRFLCFYCFFLCFTCVVLLVLLLFLVLLSLQVNYHLLNKYKLSLKYSNIYSLQEEKNCMPIISAVVWQKQTCVCKAASTGHHPESKILLLLC